jgi:hypothetical protein
MHAVVNPPNNARRADNAAQPGRCEPPPQPNITEKERAKDQRKPDWNNSDNNPSEDKYRSNGIHCRVPQFNGSALKQIVAPDENPTYPFCL